MALVRWSKRVMERPGQQPRGSHGQVGRKVCFLTRKRSCFVPGYGAAEVLLKQPWLRVLPADEAKGQVEKRVTVRGVVCGQSEVIWLQVRGQRRVGG